MIARLSVTTIVNSAVADCTVKRPFIRCDSGMVSVGLKAMMLVYAV